MSCEEHLVENAIMAYKNSKDYFDGRKEFNCELNRRQAEIVLGNSNHMENLYEIILCAYEYN